MKKLLYSVIDVLTFGRGISKTFSGFRVRLVARYSRYFKKEYEHDNIAFIDSCLQPGMTAIDIGAHIGLLSVIMGQKAGPAGRVHAFEPTPSSFQLLKRTIDINGLNATVKPVNKAVAAKSGKAVFYMTDIEAHNSNSLADNKNRDNVRGVEIDITSLDEHAAAEKLDRVDFIKIDAEGAELAVLKGASQLIRTHKPRIHLSLHPIAIKNFGDSQEEIWDFLQSNGYRVFNKYGDITRDYFITEQGLFDVHLV